MSLVRINWKPRARLLRQFGLLVLPLVGLVLAAMAHWKSHDRLETYASIAVAAIGFVLGLARPSLLRPLFVGLSLVTFPIGWVGSYVILTLLFVAVFAPAAAIMRLFGRDPMTRAWDTSAQSYWIPRKQKRDLERHFRQF